LTSLLPKKLIGDVQHHKAGVASCLKIKQIICKEYVNNKSVSFRGECLTTAWVEKVIGDVRYYLAGNCVADEGKLGKT